MPAGLELTWLYPRHQNDDMQLFLFSGINFLMIAITFTFLNP